LAEAFIALLTMHYALCTINYAHTTYNYTNFQPKIYYFFRKNAHKCVLTPFFDFFDTKHHFLRNVLKMHRNAPISHSADF